MLNLAGQLQARAQREMALEHLQRARAQFDPAIRRGLGPILVAGHDARARPVRHLSPVTAPAGLSYVIRIRRAVPLWVADPVLDRGSRPPARPPAEMHRRGEAPHRHPTIQGRTTERGDAQDIPCPQEGRSEHVHALRTAARELRRNARAGACKRRPTVTADQDPAALTGGGRISRSSAPTPRAETQSGIARGVITRSHLSGVACRGA